MEINNNCDLGETSKFCSTKNDPLLLGIVNSENIDKDDSKGIYLNEGIFKTSSTFNIGAFALMILLAGIYSFFW